MYSGPRYPRELVGYGARPDATDPRGYRSGVRMAVPVSRWQIADGLPTIPTVLIGAPAVVLAFIIGHASGGGSSGSAAVTSQTTGVVVTTTTLPATHTVAAGESLSSIATIYALSPQVLATYNNLSNANHLYVGEVLKLPPPSTATTPTTKKK